MKGLGGGRVDQLVQYQRAASARDIVLVGHEGLLLVSQAPGAVMSRTGAAHVGRTRGEQAGLGATAGPRWATGQRQTTRNDW